VNLLQSQGILPSMSRPANPYDNASCESFMRTLKREEIYANTYRDLQTKKPEKVSPEAWPPYSRGSRHFFCGHIVVALECTKVFSQ
jgi:transposase InsO family protein